MDLEAALEDGEEEVMGVAAAGTVAAAAEVVAAGEEVDGEHWDRRSRCVNDYFQNNQLTLASSGATLGAEYPFSNKFAMYNKTHWVMTSSRFLDILSRYSKKHRWALAGKALSHVLAL